MSSTSSVDSPHVLFKPTVEDRRLARQLSKTSAARKTLLAHEVETGAVSITKLSRRQMSRLSAIATARHELDARKAHTIVHIMRAKGLSLSVSHERGGRRWWLSNGEPVPDAIARRVIADTNIVGVSDSLFPSGPAQTYRHVSTEK